MASDCEILTGLDWLAKHHDCMMDAASAHAARSAADEIERLQAENAALVEALRTKDSCARQCEGAAYREEAKRLKLENAALLAQLKEAAKDTSRLDWLADANQTIGNVMLPTECVEKALTLRGAIDMAMAMDGEGKQ